MLSIDFTLSQDSLIAIGMSYGQDGWGLIPSRGKRFSLLHSIQTSSGAHPASYPVGTRGSFSSRKVAGAWSWPLTSIQCRGQEWWSYTSTPWHFTSPLPCLDLSVTLQIQFLPKCCLPHVTHFYPKEKSCLFHMASGFSSTSVKIYWLVLSLQHHVIN
jgi:hypothetical protein